MLFDKLTTKFQQALGDAQSLAVANDNGFIEPVHLLSALLAQEDGGTASLLSRAGVNLAPLRNGLQQAIRTAQTRVRLRRISISFRGKANRPACIDTGA